MEGQPGSSEERWRHMLGDRPLEQSGPPPSHPARTPNATQNHVLSDSDWEGLIEHDGEPPDQSKLNSLEATMADADPAEPVIHDDLFTPNGILSNELDNLEIIAKLDMQVIEDVPAEIEEFARLATHRKFQEAMDYFREVLFKHRLLFPVAAELAEFLLVERGYLQLETITGELLAEWETSNSSQITAEEIRLFRLYHCFARIQTNGFLGDAITLARSCRLELAQIEPEQLTDVQVRMTCTLVDVESLSTDLSSSFK
ncbi:hypothetical protein ANO11243_068390 [Dothideomycetidae sp. 11243]|nr:hypothetical protein ANO11243_068390 [fungal sp. No.11243]